MPGQVFFDSGQQSMVVYDGTTWHTVEPVVVSTIDHNTAYAVEWAFDRMKAEQSIADMSAKYPLVADAIKQLEVTLKLCSNVDDN